MVMARALLSGWITDLGADAVVSGFHDQAASRPSADFRPNTLSIACRARS